ncbi:exonuclease domain-containing protein [Actinoalloteichus spitiensis]|uniref:exonuclease domain-containing protein n=1 Tax=Actinoalloteichus spitiensis TaxID=252394 RepID=UPI00035E8310|nr:exonuclease domain-containing protein [Actinoalloteichus spitiensis]
MTGYAVVDLETTGLAAALHDRVVEIAILHVDRDGTITDEWCTLINPHRDLGPQHVHGISASDVRGAPTFDRVAGLVAEKLAGRVLVAHNLSFDAGFLSAEFARTGVTVPLDAETGVCTMRLAKKYLPRSRRSLAACCAAVGLRQTAAHEALHDARAAAGLLGYYLGAAGRPEPWADLFDRAENARWPLLPVWDLPEHTRRRRVPLGERPHFLERLPEGHCDGPAEPASAEAYLALLDTALLDHVISQSEQDALVDLAGRLDLRRETARDLHRAYLRASVLARTTTPFPASGRLAAPVLERETTSLVRLAALLGLSAAEAAEADRAARDSAPRPSATVQAEAVARPGRFTLARGDRVVFTGATREPREVWQHRAAAAGLAVTPENVSRRTRLVVAADPDSMSTKARRARAYQIPIVTEDGFARLLAGMGAA